MLRTLHDHFAAELGTPDQPATVTAVAEALGETRSPYERSIRKDQAQVSTVRRWLDAWKAAGRPDVPDAVIAAAVRG